MRLVRFGERGAEKPGMLDADGAIRDLSGIIPDLSGAALGRDGLERLAALDPDTLPEATGDPRLGVPVAGVGKIVCVGLNYSDHAAETGAPIPAEPILFQKAITSLNGPFDPVMMPKDAAKLDWEVELGIVVGSRARHVSETDALAHVAGFCVVNDVSERAFQIERSGQWTKGKSADTFCPVGPWLVTTDAIPDVQALDMFLDVNGTRRQTGSTRTMIFGAAFCVSYISRFMTLEPGDVIATGTPPGVGMGMKPPVWLQVGDRMRLGIEGLGEQSQEVVAFA